MSATKAAGKNAPLNCHWAGLMILAGAIALAVAFTVGHAPVPVYLSILVLYGTVVTAWFAVTAYFSWSNSARPDQGDRGSASGGTPSAAGSVNPITIPAVQPPKLTVHVETTYQVLMGLAIFTATAGLFAGPDGRVLTPSSILQSKAGVLVLYAVFMSFAIRFYLGTSFSFESFADRSRRRRLFFLNYSGEMVEAAIFVGMALGLNYSPTAFFSWLTALVLLGVFDNLFIWLFPDIRAVSPTTVKAVLRTFLWPYPPDYDESGILPSSGLSMYRPKERLHSYRTHRYWVYADIAECSVLLFSQPLLFHTVPLGYYPVVFIVLFLVALTLIDTVVDTLLISQFEDFPYHEG